MPKMRNEPSMWHSFPFIFLSVKTQNLFPSSISLEFLKHLSPIISLCGFQVFPVNKCNNTGSICPRVWEGGIHVVFGLPAWNPFPFYCLEYVTFCQSNYFSKKRLLAHCMTVAALRKHPRSLALRWSTPKVSAPHGKLTSVGVQTHSGFTEFSEKRVSLDT